MNNLDYKTNPYKCSNIKKVLNDTNSCLKAAFKSNVKSFSSPTTGNIKLLLPIATGCYALKQIKGGGGGSTGHCQWALQREIPEKKCSDVKMVALRTGSFQKVIGRLLMVRSTQRPNQIQQTLFLLPSPVAGAD